MPQLGFGVFLVPPDEVVEPVRAALDAGYRLIDTATLYGNEEGVGRAIRDSGIARDELFVTTKVWNTDQGYDETLRAFDNSLRAAGPRVVDLYLIHWPAPKRDRYVETWKALERSARRRARARHRRVELHRRAPVPPARRDRCRAGRQPDRAAPAASAGRAARVPRRHDIVTESWSPLGRGQGCWTKRRSSTSPASTSGHRPRWCCAGICSSGLVVIPKSVRARTNPRELAGLRLRADGRTTWTHCRCLPSRAHRPRPRHDEPLSDECPSTAWALISRLMESVAEEAGTARTDGVGNCGQHCR